MLIKKLAEKIGSAINAKKGRRASKGAETNYLTSLGELRARGYSIDSTSLNFDGLVLTYSITASKKEKPASKK